MINFFESWEIISKTLGKVMGIIGFFWEIFMDTDISMKVNTVRVPDFFVLILALKFPISFWPSRVYANFLHLIVC